MSETTTSNSQYPEINEVSSENIKKIIKTLNISENEITERSYNIKTNLAYIATIIGLVYLLFELLRDEKNILGEKKIWGWWNIKSEYTLEIVYIIMLILVIIITMVNSMYYHDCGGDLGTNENCKNERSNTTSANNTNTDNNIFYNARDASKNDLLFAGTSLIGILLLIPTEYSKYKMNILFYCFIVLNVILSFNLKNKMMIGHGLTTLIVFIITIGQLGKNLMNPCRDLKYNKPRIFFVFFGFVFLIAAFIFFSKGSKDKIKELYDEIREDENKYAENREEILKLLNQDESDHGKWHIMGALSGLSFILYKAFDIKNLDLDREIYKRIGHILNYNDEDLKKKNEYNIYMNRMIEIFKADKESDMFTHRFNKDCDIEKFKEEMGMKDEAKV